VKVWEAATGRELLSLPGPPGHPCNLAFGPGGTRLALAGNQGHSALKVWDLATGQEALSLKGHTDLIDSVAFTPDGRQLASSSWDGTVKVWDLATGQEALSLRDHTARVVSLAFSPDGTRLASASTEGAVKVWDARPWAPEAALEREALGRLDFLFARPLCKADVIDYLRNVPTTRPPAQQLALSLVDHYREETDAKKYSQARPGPVPPGPLPRSPGHADGGRADERGEPGRPGLPGPDAASARPQGAGAGHPRPPAEGHAPTGVDPR
jgi:hypothetical protein